MPAIPDSIGYDVWVLKINSDLDADFEWSVQMGTAAYDIPTAMVIDDDNNVYVVGTTTDSSGVLSEFSQP